MFFSGFLILSKYLKQTLSQLFKGKKTTVRLFKKRILDRHDVKFVSSCPLTGRNFYPIISNLYKLRKEKSSD